MKKISFIFGFILTVLAVGCRHDTAPVVDALVCQKDSASYSLLFADGRIVDLVPDGQKPSAVVNGYFTLTSPMGVTVCSISDSVVSNVPGLKNLYAAGFMADGVIPIIRKNGHIEVANKEGETICTVEAPGEYGTVESTDAIFRYGTLKVCTDKGLYGLMDTKGKWLILPCYEMLGNPDREGIFVAQDTLGHYLAIDKTGGVKNRLSEGCSVPVPEIMGGKIIVVDSVGIYGIFDYRKGATTHFDKPIRKVISCRDGYILARTDLGVAIFGLNGEEIYSAGGASNVYLGNGGVVAQQYGTEWVISHIADTGKRVAIAGAESLVPMPAAAAESGFCFLCRGKGTMFAITSGGTFINNAPLAKIDFNALPYPGMSLLTPKEVTKPFELPEEEPESL